jgi:hypothetical protein
MSDSLTDDLRPGATPNWSADAPKGGRAVIRRMLSDSASTVPLFLGQTFVRSLRDVGYNDSISAVCEHVDNAVQWGAKNVRVYFNQRGRRGDTKIDVLVLDDGQGMSPETLRVAMSFGGSTVYDRRDGIGRFGVGMKTAALSMGPRLEVYSWQEGAGIYSMELDVEDIGSNLKNMIELDEPVLHERLPIEIINILTQRMEAPRGLGDQELLTSDANDLTDLLGPHGTIVFVPDCDRVTYKEAKALYESAAREMSRIYRRMIAEGLKLYVNNKVLEPFDPTYWMKESRHTCFEELEKHAKRSQLVDKWEVEIPVEEGSKSTSTAAARLYVLPEAWHTLPGSVQRRQLRIFDDHQVSYMRNGREVAIGPSALLNLKRHATTHWLSLQIDFTGELDEAFGVAMTKQGVRPKAYALKAIDAKIADAVSKTRNHIADIQARNNRVKTAAAQSRGERLARDADPLQRKPLPETDEEAAALDANLRALAVTLKRNDETDDQAFERVKNSMYIIQLKHDEFWPFYAVDFQYGRVILTVNTAHPFYTKLYRPLEGLSVVEPAEEPGQPPVPRDGELLVALQMLLFSLARTQSQMTHGADREEYRELFKSFQAEWSDNLKTQLAME